MTTQLMIAIAVLLIGIPLAKAVESIITRVHRKRYGASLARPMVSKIVFHVSLIILFAIVLGFLNIDVDLDTFAGITGVIPEILTVIIIISLVIALSRVMILIADQILKKGGIFSLLESYGLDQLYLLGYWLVFIIILLSVGSTTFHIAGYDAGPLVRILGNISLPILLFIALGIFIATKDLLREYGIGIYLRQSSMVRPGQYIIKEERRLKVHDMKAVGIMLEDEKNKEFIPYSSLLQGMRSKKTKSMLERLEDIKEHYVAQEPSYCGPASLAMILKIFNYDFTQYEIGDKAKTKVSQHGEPAGTTPQSLIDVAEKLTDGKVKGVWIDADHITDLRAELISWLKDEALVIVDYKKSYLFSSAKKAHYSVCLGVNGQELLLLDPSSKAGGVYYADYRRVHAGMDTFSLLFNGRRGYMVFAKDGTPASKRINEGLIYLDKNLYSHMSSRISKALINIQESTASSSSILPESVKRLLKKDEKITRLWRPKKKKEDGE